MLGIPTKEWYDLPSPGIMFCKTLPQELLQMDTIKDKSQDLLLYNKNNPNIMRVRDTILAAAAESGIG